MGKNDEGRTVSVINILDKIFSKEPKTDVILTDDERELRDYEANVYMAESGVTDDSYAEFVIDEVFYIVKKGMMVTGTVTGGVFKVGDHIAICRGEDDVLETELSAIEQFGNECDKVAEGAVAGFLLANDDSNLRKLIKRNDIIKKI